MTYTGRHRKISPLKIARRRAAITALVAGAVAAGGGVANAAPTSNGTGTAGTNGVAGNAADYVPADVRPNVTSGAQLVAGIPGLPSEVSDFLGPVAGSVDAVTPEKPADTVVKPTEGSLTSGYGPRWGAMHNGIDVANAKETPIYAIMSGTVIDAGPASGYGNWIRVLHDDGSVSVYGHMQTLAAAVGDKVSAGQYIAGMGDLGQTTGTNLHFQIQPDGSTPVDPQAWFAERGVEI